MLSLKYESVEYSIPIGGLHLNGRGSKAWTDHQRAEDLRSNALEDNQYLSFFDLLQIDPSLSNKEIGAKLSRMKQEGLTENPIIAEVVRYLDSIYGLMPLEDAATRSENYKLYHETMVMAKRLLEETGLQVKGLEVAPGFETDITEHFRNFTRLEASGELKKIHYSLLELNSRVLDDGRYEKFFSAFETSSPDADYNEGSYKFWLHFSPAGDSYKSLDGQKFADPIAAIERSTAALEEKEQFTGKHEESPFIAGLKAIFSGFSRA